MEAVVQAYAGGTAEGGHNRELAGANDGETAQEEEHGRAATAAIVTVLARLRVVSSEGSRQNNAATPATITHITTNTICHVIPGLLCWVGEYAGQVREEYCAADTSAGLVVALQGERW